MLQDIAPHKLHNEFVPCAPAPNDLVFAFAEAGPCALLRAFDQSGGPLTDEAAGALVNSADLVLPASGAPRLIFPRVADYRKSAPGRLSALRYLFRIDQDAVFLDTAPGDAALPGFAMLPHRLFRLGLPQELSFAGATAWHLRGWYRTSRYCGRCGSLCVPDEKERAMRCPSCGLMIYPRINPAVIIGVTSGDKIILSRYAEGHQSSIYNTGARTYRGRSLVAGYCEIGETLEDTVRREVMEEVGLAVKNISFYKSQPWGFDGALLIGFFCEADGDGTIRRDPSELAEAFWCSRAEIGEVPGSASLTNEMIRKFRDTS